jgi:ATP phosphoribosyltransferase
MVLPKGRLYNRVAALLNDAGIVVEANDRLYIPSVEDPEVEAKIMKPQNIAQLVEVGSHDVGFTGYDWMVETAADVETLLDLRFDPVEIVAAVPDGRDEGSLRQERIVVASEYQNIALNYLNGSGYDFYFIRTFGATEVFPPEDADMIIDNISSGRTLREHHLKVVGHIMTSSTRLIANKAAMDDRWKRTKIEGWLTLFQGVLNARGRVMLEMNVPEERFEAVVKICPCMRAPTVSSLSNGAGYSIKIAVERAEAAKLIPRLKRMGATDILEYEFRKVVV